ncbi:MAG: beta-hexosaminidase [Erysipelotrichaceae bacterium]|nr:beta-hexosaminidase [Erysipelotrichaceae bacterium]
MRKKLILLILTITVIILEIYILNHDTYDESQSDNISNIIESTNDTTNKELFEEYYKQAEELMSTMTLEEKVGQMFIARYPTTANVIDQIKNENPGGYILFEKHFRDETKESMLEKLTKCQDASNIPLLLGVDEEGGTVVRVSSITAFRNTKFKSPQTLYNKGGYDAIIEDSKEKSELLLSIGLNMNFAPVADVSTSSSDFIYNRSFGKDANETSIYVSTVVKTMNTSHIISCLKHFPGYGSNGDTHTDIIIDERDYETFDTSDFLPFSAGIESNAPTILVSHNVITCMDEDYPASLSRNVHDILRNELGFTGVIITDDLKMDAVQDYVQDGSAAVLAVQAGNDMIISSNFVKQKQEVVNAVNDGTISEEIIDTAVRRILAMKYAYSIIS